jgi:hypothetical protein
MIRLMFCIAAIDLALCSVATTAFSSTLAGVFLMWTFTALAVLLALLATRRAKKLGAGAW